MATYKFFSLFFFILLIAHFHAYESTFRKGYNNCLACHHSPRGGGMLTDYGKMVASTQILFGRNYSEGAFKKTIRLNGKIDHNLKVRIAQIRSENATETFPMQGDYLAAFTGKKLKILSQLARAPQRGNTTNEEEKPKTLEQFYFRELKAIYAVKNNFLLSVGREKQDVGLRVEDHTLYNKSFNRFNITDLTTTAALDYFNQTTNLTLALFAPSYQEIESTREKGLKAEIRKSLGKIQLGFTTLLGESPSIKRIVAAPFVKIALGPLYLVYDAVFSRRATDQEVKFGQSSHLIRLSYFPFDFLEIFTLGERITRRGPFALTGKKLGSGFHFRMHRNFGLRFDWKRSFLTQRNEDLAISQLVINWW